MKHLEEQPKKRKRSDTDRAEMIRDLVDFVYDHPGRTMAEILRGFRRLVEDASLVGRPLVREAIQQGFLVEVLNPDREKVMYHVDNLPDPSEWDHLSEED